MAYQVYLDNVYTPLCSTINDVLDLKTEISKQSGIPCVDLFVTINGRKVDDDLVLRDSKDVVRINTRLLGGKGGFGSMLRAIGAQIEKTTNREACRDLSGRRLRDINEEKRLRKWLDGQADREREAAERKQKKLERLIAGPKVTVQIDDAAYEKERQDLPDRIGAAVDAGWEAASSNEGALKRKSEDIKQKSKKKKSKLWIDAELSECSSSDEETETTVANAKILITKEGSDSDHASTSSSN